MRMSQLAIKIADGGGNSVSDPDGHIIEVMYMPPEAYEGKQ